MEQKKTLWIIAAVGVFLLVVIGAAMIMYSPSQAVDPAIASLQTPNDTWTSPVPVENGTIGVLPESEDFAVDTQNAGLPNGEATPLDEMTVISGTTNVYGTGSTTIDLNNLKGNRISGVVSNSPSKPNSTLPTSPSESVAVKNIAKSSDHVVAVSAEVPSKKAPPVKNIVPTKPHSSSTDKVEKPQAPVKKGPQYWVQAASFTTKSNADNARKTLEANKISSEVFTYEKDGNLYYRLRVGPYTTKTEADYWKDRIVLIDEFANTESYVTNSSAKK